MTAAQYGAYARSQRRRDTGCAFDIRGGHRVSRSQRPLEHTRANDMPTAPIPDGDITDATPILPPPKVVFLLEQDLAASMRCTLSIDGKIVADGTSIGLALWMVWNTCQARSVGWTEAQRQHVADGLVDLTHRIFEFEPGIEIEADWNWNAVAGSVRD